MCQPRLDDSVSVCRVETACSLLLGQAWPHMGAWLGAFVLSAFFEQPQHQQPHTDHPEK